MSPQPPEPHLVVFHHPGPRWQHGVAAFGQDGLQRHIEHYRGLLEQGRLFAGGPFLDEAGGGMMLALPGTDPDELATFAGADPCVQDGLLTFSIRPWFLGMGG